MEYQLKTCYLFYIKRGKKYEILRVRSYLLYLLYTTILKRDKIDFSVIEEVYYE